MGNNVTDFSNFSLSTFLQTRWRKETRLEVCLSQVTVVIISLSAKGIKEKTGENLELVCSMTYPASQTVTVSQMGAKYHN